VSQPPCCTAGGSWERSEPGNARDPEQIKQFAGAAFINAKRLLAGSQHQKIGLIASKAFG
jgi:hypothetical protein